ncbi:MAG: tetratricopeptide repeat protein [Candidatus Hydrogenedentes bacterium]|nr:tetratricopeptide repeat protein [Candidatus Hydrogenedentota bacterium]
MMIRISRPVVLSVVMLSVVGCTTLGSAGQMEQTVYDIHRRVTRLDENLGASITKLSETTAELVNRVNESDEQTRRLKSLVEENQVKIDNLDRSMNELKAVLYQHFNLTPPSAGGVIAPLSGVETDVNTVIEPPQPVTVPQSTLPLETETLTPAPDPEAMEPVAPVAQQTPAGGGSPKVAYESAQRAFGENKFEQALTDFDRFLATYPAAEDAHNAQFWKAKCHFKLGQFQESASEFQKLRNSYPNSTKVPFAMHNQAMAYSRLNQKAEAEALLNELIKNYPLTPAAEQAKVDLQTLQGR